VGVGGKVDEGIWVVVGREVDEDIGVGVAVPMDMDVRDGSTEDVMVNKKVVTVSVGCGSGFAHPENTSRLRKKQVMILLFILFSR